MKALLISTTCAVLLVIKYGVGKELHGLSLLQSAEENRLEYNQTYPGCWLGNKFYMVGDKWNPAIEPYGVMNCVKCQCAQIVKQNVVQIEGKVLCRNIKTDCPKVSCRNPRLRPNTCCKVCNKKDAQFEDQFSRANIGSIPTVSTHSAVLKPNQGMSALLTGSRKRSNQPIRTKAVALLHINTLTGTGLKYYIRFSRLKTPVALLFKDQSGSILIEVILSAGKKRRGTIRGVVKSIPSTVVESIVRESVWCSITTLRHKDGEISGLLTIDHVTTPALFEAVLNPPIRNGFGGHMTIYYDSVTSHAPYVVQIQDHSIAKPGSEFYVTIEKDTEIIYQHLLRLSKTENKLIGRLKLDRKISKQIARGRLHGRVTSRTGELITGVIKPRLVRSDVLSLISARDHNVTGFMIGRVLESGALSYKVFIDGAHDIYHIAVQRLVQGTLKWKTIFKINNRQWAGHDSSRLIITDEYKKLKVNDLYALLDGKLRIRLVSGDITTYSAFKQITVVNLNLLKDPSMTLRTPYCEGRVFVWYKLTSGCTLQLYTEYLDDRTNFKPRKISVTIKSVLDPLFGVVTQEFQIDVDQPEVTLVNISDAILKDLNAGGAYVHIYLENKPCDRWRTMIQIPNKCWRYTDYDDVTSQSALNEIDKATDTTRMYTCHHEGRFYQHGESWLPARSNACVTCRCERGTAYCDDVLCPPSRCSHPIKRPGECCSVCAEDNETEQKPVGSCFYPGDKRWHSFGTYWHPYVPPFGYSNCSICTCVPDTGEVNCSRLACPELECPGYQRVRVNRDDCCQTCQGHIQSKLISTPVKYYTSNDCKFGTTLYKHGDKWHPVLTPFGKMTCYICSCKRGKIRCRKKKCPVLRCKRQYRPTGHCCPVCKNKPTHKHQNKQDSYQPH